MEATKMSDPTFWAVINQSAPVVGWTFLCACIGFATRWVWKARGTLDEFTEGQKHDRELATKTLASIESAKKVALDTVAAAQAHGAEKAADILESVRTLDTNHLAHIEMGINELSASNQRLVDMQKEHLKLAGSMSESLAVLKDRGIPKARK
jgi:hypothetical protein